MEFKQYVCPLCKHQGLDYETSYLEGEYFVEEWQCPNCKLCGEEWLSLEFETYKNLHNPIDNKEVILPD